MHLTVDANAEEEEYHTQQLTELMHTEKTDITVYTMKYVGECCAMHYNDRNF